jgi:hypothetical protein
MPWRDEVMVRLSGGKKFLSARDVADIVAACGGPARAPVLSSNTFFGFLRELCAKRDLIKIQRDLYANMWSRPIPHPKEAAGLLRRGAVVSIHTVLGETGVLNNPTGIVHALYPLDEHHGVRRIVEGETEFGRYRFVGVTRSYLEAGPPEDRLAGTAFLQATPERAMVDWIRLSKTARMALPPLCDVDLDLLDVDRLRRVAGAVAMREAVEDWLESKMDFDRAYEKDEREYLPPGVGR